MTLVKRRRILMYQVDAFTSKPFSGNPAAVCLLDDSVGILDDETRQAIAAENNLSETAFIEQEVDGQGLTGPSSYFKDGSQFRLRWFTPTVEVPLCGHATLAAAAVLFSDLGNASEVLHFHTLSGVLTVRRRDSPCTAASGAAGSTTTADASTATLTPQVYLEMAMPLLAPSSELPAALSGERLGALKAAVLGDLPVKEVQFTGGAIQYLVVALHDDVGRGGLEGLQPDFDALRAAVPVGTVRGVIVTAHGGASGYDVLSRFFCPWLGINEDPVTGSAHSVLAPYWQQRLGNHGMTARQCSKRGGELWLHVDSGSDRVLVTGQAVTVIEGSLLL